MDILLLGHTEQPEVLCAKAAALCTGTDTSGLTEEKSGNLVARVINYGHASIAEHASFTFQISGISRTCSHQLVRHRIASYSQQSQRYVKLSSEVQWYVTPPSITDTNTEQEWHDFMLSASKLYTKLISTGIQPEDARFVLPGASSTSIIMTMNARSWREFLIRRLCATAQWEIRAVALEIRTILFTTYPSLFSSIYPDCANCKEKNKCR